MTFDDIKPDRPYSAISTKGIEIFGSEKAIDHVLRLMSDSANIEVFWRPEVLRLRARVAELEAEVAARTRSFR